MQGKYEQVLAHMMRVRGISRAAAVDEVDAAFATFELLSRFEWILDIGAVSFYADETQKILP